MVEPTAKHLVFIYTKTDYIRLWMTLHPQNATKTEINCTIMNTIDLYWIELMLTDWWKTKHQPNNSPSPKTFQSQWGTRIKTDSLLDSSRKQFLSKPLGGSRGGALFKHCLKSPSVPLKEWLRFVCVCVWLWKWKFSKKNKLINWLIKFKKSYFNQNKSCLNSAVIDVRTMKQSDSSFK